MADDRSTVPSESIHADLIINEAKAEAAEKLVELMREADSESVQLGAARALLGHGKGKKAEQETWEDYLRKNAPQE